MKNEPLLNVVIARTGNNSWHTECGSVHAFGAGLVQNPVFTSVAGRLSITGDLTHYNSAHPELLATSVVRETITMPNEVLRKLKLDEKNSTPVWTADFALLDDDGSVEAGWKT